jgi:protein-L-isoaspartate(D-aspartate) O-methyltransferase
MGVHLAGTWGENDPATGRAGKEPGIRWPVAFRLYKTRSSSSSVDLSMIDFAAARRMMVDSQVRTSDVTDLRIIAAMLDIARERYVPAPLAGLAYLDLDVPASQPESGEPVRRLLKPMVLAKLIQGAAVEAGDHVLDVGCATGYSSAILARLANAVVALEEDPALAQQASANLASAGNVTVVTGPLSQGWPALAPYDVVFINGATELMPRELGRQLKEGGRLVAIVGRAPVSRAMLYRSVGGDVSGWPIFDAGAPLLPGFAEPPTFAFYALS